MIRQKRVDVSSERRERKEYLTFNSEWTGYMISLGLNSKWERYTLKANIRNKLRN